MIHLNLEKLKGSGQYFSLMAILGIAVLVWSVSPALAATAPTLGTAQTYGVLGASTVTNTGPTFVYGDLGVNPGSAVTGSPTVTGTIHTADAISLQAQNDVTTANTALTSQGCTGDLTGQELGGMTLTPGVYCFSSSAQLTGTLTLNAESNNDAVWVFKIGSKLTTASGSSVVFINGGQDCNVFWQVGSSATLDTTTNFIGNILAYDSIALMTGAKLSGRALARAAAVTMDTNVITPSICSGTKALKVIKTASPLTYENSGDTISYTYVIKNIGNVVLSGPFTVTDDKAATGNCLIQPLSLDQGESFTCSASHTVTQADLDAGSITNTATATAEGGSVTSIDQVTVTKTGSQIPEFPTVALPVIAVIGLLCMFQRRKGK